MDILSDLKIEDNNGRKVIVGLSDLTNRLLRRNKFSRQLVDIADTLKLEGEDRFEFILCGLIERVESQNGTINQMTRRKD